AGPGSEEEVERRRADVGIGVPGQERDPRVDVGGAAASGRVPLDRPGREPPRLEDEVREPRRAVGAEAPDRRPLQLRRLRAEAVGDGADRLLVEGVVEADEEPRDVAAPRALEEVDEEGARRRRIGLEAAAHLRVTLDPYQALGELRAGRALAAHE